MRSRDNQHHISESSFQERANSLREAVDRLKKTDISLQFKDPSLEIIHSWFTVTYSPTALEESKANSEYCCTSLESLKDKISHLTKNLSLIQTRIRNQKEKYQINFHKQSDIDIEMYASHFYLFYKYYSEIVKYFTHSQVIAKQMTKASFQREFSTLLINIQKLSEIYQTLPPQKERLLSEEVMWYMLHLEDQLQFQKVKKSRKTYKSDIKRNQRTRSLRY